MSKPNPADYLDERDFWAAYRRWQSEQALKQQRN